VGLGATVAVDGAHEDDAKSVEGFRQTGQANVDLLSYGNVRCDEETG
jgi:hypothetical protein